MVVVVRGFTGPGFPDSDRAQIGHRHFLVCLGSHHSPFHSEHYVAPDIPFVLCCTVFSPVRGISVISVGHADIVISQVILAHIPSRHRSLASGNLGLEQRAPNIGRYDVRLFFQHPVLALPIYSYKFFVPGYAVHLMSTLGINGKVYFMDKHFLEPFNTSGSYELDPSLVGGPDWEDAWRSGVHHTHPLELLFSLLILKHCMFLTRSSAPQVWCFLTRLVES